MGYVYYIELSDAVLKRAIEAYNGRHKLKSKDWQAKNIDASSNLVHLESDYIIDGSEKRPHYSRIWNFYNSYGKQGTPEYEWIEFEVVYSNGRLIHIRQIFEQGGSR